MFVRQMVFGLWLPCAAWAPSLDSPFLTRPPSSNKDVAIAAARALKVAFEKTKQALPPLLGPVTDNTTWPPSCFCSDWRFHPINKARGLQSELDEASDCAEERGKKCRIAQASLKKLTAARADFVKFQARGATKRTGLTPNA